MKPNQEPPGLRQSARREGFTMVELVLAAGLLSFLMVAVFALIDGSLSMWRKSETRRNLTEQATGVVELLAHDLRSLEGGARGDVLFEWVKFDTDGDGLKETCWPRLRFVRQASGSEIARMMRTVPLTPEELAEQARTSGASEPEEKEEPQAANLVSNDEGFPGPALIEVCWAITPLSIKQRDERAEGLVYRGARRLSGAGDSYFNQGFIRGDQTPILEELDEVTAGLIWFQPLMATQTSIVHESWDIGTEAPDAATSWDAWRAERPDSTIHQWNQEGYGMPKVDGRPLLPRRIRIELEFERPKDRLRRARTLARIELTDVGFEVSDGRRLPKPGGFIKIDGEWMQLRDVRGDRITVRRGQRGTDITVHDPDALVHWGLTLVREIPVALYREDWDL